MTESRLGQDCFVSNVSTSELSYIEIITSVS